jgi:ketosteroid isomerase-like protein
MRSLIPSLVAAAAISVWPSTLLAQSRGGDSAVVASVVRQFHHALARGDSGAALALLADDAVVLEAGSIETRAEYEQHHLPADIRFVQAVPSKQGAARVVVVGDVAWTTSTSETTGTFEGRPVNSVGAELIVLSRTTRGWQIRAIHWSSRRRTGP